MSAEDIAAAYRAALEQYGETVSVSRPGTAFTASVLARPAEFMPNDMLGEVRQGDRKLILLAEDFTNADYPLPLRKGDKITLNGNEMNLEFADDMTARVGGTTIAIIARVRGRP